MNRGSTLYANEIKGIKVKNISYSIKQRKKEAKIALGTGAMAFK